MSGAPSVLVVGGAGYVGGQTCKALASAGFAPVVYDDLSNGHDWAVRWGPFERGDLRDEARLVAVIERHRPVAVVHFAALIEAGISVVDPARFYDINVAGTLALLNAMRRTGLARLVFSSTAAVYGAPRELPIPESHPLAPVNPYGRTKLAVEWMLGDFARAYGIGWVALRYFNAAGADPDGEIGEAHDPETHLIPLALDAAAGRRPEIAVFGSDYPTPDGTCVRDYVHVADLASAHLLALAHLDRGGASGAYNLGNGAGFSVAQVIEAAGRVVGRPVPTRMAPRRVGDPPRLVSDSSRARAELGWRPARPDLDVMIADAWRWHRKRFGV
ncbi:MAG: UDP-glucose 4-epimerase GalE [Alphaproteobacteria bacterium]|nr:UDP-glucose 4-epimerase GalE [Alphaproteobacteria bacterium]MBF0393003.1 UDP-glucose 4-epimerase GalE [Alphaproteobacteria bacterium]